MKKVLIVDDSRSWITFHYENLVKIFGENIEIDKALSARAAYDWIYNYIDNPYDLIITDLQMESEFANKFAGEWLIEQIKLLKQYCKTKIVIISGASSIKKIAEQLNVEYIPKMIAARNTDIYGSIFD